MTEINNDTSVAIIGMSGRFPGASDVDGFWQNLCDGVASIKSFSDAELTALGVPKEVFTRPEYVNASPVLDDIDMFDAAFFGYSPRKAEVTDPQHRMLLECAYEALEDGCHPPGPEDRTGVFVGIGLTAYLLQNVMHAGDKVAAVGSHMIIHGNDKSFAATHISYKLNLTGPSLVVDTGCSSTLATVHLAAKSLLNFECDLALAGGAQVSEPQGGYLYQQGGPFSSDGQCRAFDAQASGTVFGSGVGVVLLKRLDEAIEAGDRIYAVLLGSAMNNDGSDKVGYTAPSVEGQKTVIEEALAFADIDPQTISYVETHGTGTVIGDPIELTALTEAYASESEETGYCAIGSVKTNVGHLDVAAGIAGLIKVCKALYHGKIPASLNFKTPNPAIDWANSPFYVNTQLSDWAPADMPKRAAVSSLGIGGTNVHAILQEAPQPESQEGHRQTALLTFSGRTPEAVTAMSQRLATYLEQNKDLSLDDVAYSLHVGRAAYEHRGSLAIATDEDPIAALKDPARLRLGMANSQPTIAFMFPGQGAQYVSMLADVYAQEPMFREQVDYCAELLEPMIGLDLRELIYPPQGYDKADERLKETRYTQPALFVVEYALANLLQAWGLFPDVMIGHSIGEYVAAHLAGVFSLEDALLLVSERGRLMSQLPPGAMLSISDKAQIVEELLEMHTSIAAYNAPDRCVASGPVEEIQRLEERLKAQGVSASRLHTSCAFHSPMTDTVLPAFRAVFQRVQLNEPEMPFVGNVYGQLIEDRQAIDPEYWVEHLRQSVRFADGIQSLADEIDLFIEVGPGRTLSSLAKRCGIQRSFTTSRHPNQTADDHLWLQDTLGQLWCEGAAVDWVGYHEDETRLKCGLPTYPFERQRYWIDSKERSLSAYNSAAAEGPRNPNQWFYEATWQPKPLSGSELPESMTYLAFVDDVPQQDALLSALEPFGRVIRVYPGASFAQQDNNRYQIDPSNEHHMVQMMDMLAAERALPSQVLHLWTLEDAADTSLDRSFFSGFHLCRQLGNRGQRARVHFVTRNVHPLGSVEPRPLVATILGLCKVAPQEYPSLSCIALDWDGTHHEGIIQELRSADGDRVIAYRDGTRYVEGFQRTTAPGAANDLPAESVWLITGGLGRIGMLQAEQLAGKGPVKLVLVNRSPFPSKNAWDKFLAENEPTHETSQKIHRLRHMESLGATVWIAQADVSDMHQMRSLMQEVVSRWGKLHGLIHSAGQLHENALDPLSQTDRTACLEQFEAKINGLNVLLEALQGHRPSFVLLQSSIATVLGGLGFAAYAAANHYLDAFAYAHDFLSVNWDGWNFADDADHSGFGADMARDAIRPDEGRLVFDRLLNHSGNRLVIASSELEPRLERWVGEATWSEVTEQKAVVDHNQVTQVIMDIWRDVLGVESISSEDNFFEIGGDSHLLTQVHRHLTERLGATLTAVELFNFPTVAALAEHLSQESVSEPTRQRVQQVSSDDIAIVGMAGRFPGARDIDAYWQLIEQGREAIVALDDAALLADGVDPALVRHPNYIKLAPLLDDIDQFDAAFFGFTPREAETTDPQQRFLLECAQHALDDAAVDPARFHGEIGVFVGVAASTYLIYNLFDNEGGPMAAANLSIQMGNDKDFAATRIAYKLNLTGPAINMNTACSTSLVAVCKASQSLLNGECDMALAGGSRIGVPHRSGYLYEDGSIFSKDGHLRAFDKAASGTIFGSGTGVVALKRLSDAQADGDAIHAVIKGFAINNDGSSKVSYTAPSIPGQVAVINNALAQADVDVNSIGYIETHGTGTPMGDPIEMAALNQAFRGKTDQTQFCAIGSVKANIGHLDAAAGVAGLIKAVLVLKHGVLPPSINFEEPNPDIDFENSPFYVNTKLNQWPLNDPVRRASVSSFGIGGTNAHVILEQAPQQETAESASKDMLFLLSARSVEGLSKARTELAEYLESHPETPLSSVAHTLQVGRGEFSERLCITASHREEAITLLKDGGSALFQAAGTTKAPRVTMLFSGQGSQHLGMFADLYENHAVFRECLDQCSELLKPYLEDDLVGTLFGQDEAKVNDTCVAQPALFSVSYALQQLLSSWGITADTMIGHSIGEYVAAHLAGVFSLEDALKLVAKRGEVMAAQEPGAMLSVSLPEAETAAYLNESLSLAAVNGPGSCVVSGSLDAINTLARELGNRGVDHQRLKTSHAFHSWMMDGARDAFLSAFEGIELHRPKKPFCSNVTGQQITDEEATDPNYWWRHLRGTVRFDQCLQNLKDAADTVFLEVGPGQALTSLVRRNMDQAPAIACARRPKNKRKDDAQLLEAVGKLWCVGLKLDWQQILGDPSLRRVHLPGYPFQKQAYWVEPLPRESRGSSTRLITGVEDWFYRPTWSRSTFAKEATQGHTMFLVHQDSVGDRVARECLKKGSRVTIVYPGASFSANGDHFTVAPNRAEDYVALIDAIAQSGGLPDQVVHCWLHQEGDTEVETAIGTGFFATMTLAGILAPKVEHLTIRLVANRLFSVMGLEDLDASRSSLQGAALSLPKLYDHLDVGLVDIPLDSDAQRLLNRELASPVGTVWARGNYRWQQSLEAYMPTPEVDMRLQNAGFYIASGVSTELGRDLTDLLARQLQAHLILLGDANADLEQRLLRSGATSVQWLSSLNAQWLETAEADLGPLKGMLLATGLESTVAATVEQAHLLTQLANDRKAFLAFATSWRGLIGDPERADQAALSAYLGGLAEKARIEGIDATCMFWDDWRDRHGEGISPIQAWQALGRALSNEQPRLLIAPRTPLAISRSLKKREALARPELATNYVEPQGETEQQVAQIWQELLGVHRVGAKDPFLDLGGHSLLMAQLATRLRSLFQVDLDVETLFEHDTVASQANLIVQKLASNVDEDLLLQMLDELE